MPSNKDATPPPEAPDLATIKLIDYDFAKYGSADERTRLLTKWDEEVGVAAALSGDGTAHRPPARTRAVAALAGGRLARLLPAALVRGRRRLLEPRLAPRRLAARRGRTRRRCSSGLWRGKPWLAPLAPSCCCRCSPGGRGRPDPAFGRPDRRHRRPRPRLARRAGLRHRPARLALRLARGAASAGSTAASSAWATARSLTALAFLFLLTHGLAARGAVQRRRLRRRHRSASSSRSVALFIFYPIAADAAERLRRRRRLLARPPSCERLFSDRASGRSAA